MAVTFDFEFCISGLALLATSIFGIIGNFISILILQRKGCQLKLNPTFSQLLTWSALIDTVLLVKKKTSSVNITRKITQTLKVLICPIFSLPVLSWEFRTKVYPLLLPSIYPLGHIALTGRPGVLI